MGRVHSARPGRSRRGLDVAADAAPARPATRVRRAGPTGPARRPVRRGRRCPTGPASAVPTTSAAEPGATPTATPRRRVRDRLARRIVAGPRPASARCWSRWLRCTGRATPRPTSCCCSAAYDVAEAAHARPEAQERRPLHHPPARRRHHPGRAWAWTPPPWSRRCCTTPSRTPASPWRRSPPSSAPRSRHLVDGVTKIDKVKFGDAAQAETIRKMIVAMARDPRVLVIKLADRLHNMRTLRFLPPEKQEKKARETLEILAPLAHRLGMNTIKWELEDLAFATLYPKRYDEIVRLVAERAPSRDTYLAEVDRRGQRPVEGREDRGRRHRPAQALLLDLPEDDRPRPRLHRHLGPRRHPDPGRLGARLLRGAGHHARALAAGARPLQGLRGDAEVQHVPVAAHDRDRPAGQAGRAADPHARHAPHRRVRHRGALEVQGEGPVGGKPSAGEFGAPGRHADDMLWLRQLLDWQREAQEPGEFLETLRYDLGRRRSSSSRPRAT